MKPRLPELAATVLSWIGLALMAAAFLALLQWRPPLRPQARASETIVENVGPVVIDPGHGGADSGATAGTVAEKDLTLDVSRRLSRLLAERGVATILTRSDDFYVPLAQRAAVTNRVRDAILVSIHFNDGVRPLASGVETYFAPHQSTQPLASWLPFLPSAASEEPNVQSQSLAAFVQEELVRETGSFNRGIKCEEFYVLSRVHHPAVLVEAGFLTNKEDAGRLADEKYREQLARAIAQGIARYRSAVRARGEGSQSVVGK